MGYKFVVDYYYIENCTAFGTGVGHKGFYHPEYSKVFSIKNKVKVSPQHWPHNYRPVVVLEGPHKGKLLWVQKEDLKSECK